MSKWHVAGILVAFLMGCSPSPEGRQSATGVVAPRAGRTTISTQPANTAHPPASETPVSTQQENTAIREVAQGTSKVTPPLDARLTFPTDQLAVGKEFAGTFSFVPDTSIPRAVIRTEVSGVVSAREAADATWTKLQAGESKSVPIRLMINGLGEGQVAVSVEAQDEAGATLYGKSTVVYVLATRQGVLTGTTSPSLLKLEYLERERQAGRITQQEYEEEREKVLGGGATESNTPRSSAP